MHRTGQVIEVIRSRLKITETLMLSISSNSRYMPEVIDDVAEFFTPTLIDNMRRATESVVDSES